MLLSRLLPGCGEYGDRRLVSNIVATEHDHLSFLRPVSREASDIICVKLGLCEHEGLISLRLLSSFRGTGVRMKALFQNP